MPLHTDQIGRTIEIPQSPQNIVSIVPSQTELLFDLGLREEVTGITKFCIHPSEWFRSKQRVGGTKQLNIDKIKKIKPDLIIANKEENVEDQVKELADQFPVWVSDINNLDEALNMISSIGEIVQKKFEAENLILKIKEGVKDTQIQTKYKACYLIWQKPYMTIGGDTFINDMMSRCGFENVYGNKTRYPTIELSELETLNCDLVLLSSEPYPFKEKHISEIKKMLPNAKALLVDGEMFSWYGSRLQYAPAYFKSLQHQISSL